MNIETIFMDFDGVVLESVDIKTQAFVDLFADHPEHTEKIIKLHVENGGMSRFEKFRIICTEFLGEQYGKEKEERLADRFSELVFEKVLACPFVPGAREFLKEWSSRIPIYVISGTPTEEIRKIVELRELGFAFRGVFGSPEKKGHWTKFLIEEKKLNPAACRFVGDAGSDLRAARQNGVPFVGRVKEGEFDAFANEGEFPRIPDLTTLAQALGLE